MAVSIRLVAGVCLALVAVAVRPVSGQEIAGVAVVHSGNEVEIDGKRIRLFGVEAPEPESLCDFGEGQFQCGIIAWAELIQLADGRAVSCDLEKKQNADVSYATCYVGERDVNEALVRSGWAEAAMGEDRYRVDQEDARRARRGMWAGRVRPPDRRQAP